jgi:polysaccharide pyruvyl transferase CsaB
MTDKRTYRIGIFGSYGYWNHGDEAILASILGQIRAEVQAEVTVFSQNDETTKRLHQVEHVVAVRKLTRDELRPELEGLDLLIIGGGGILYDEWVRKHFTVEALAMEMEIPIMIYGAGAGPLEDESSIEQVVALVGAAREVTVRDRSAKQVLERLGITREIHITADPALLLEAEPLPEGLFEREGIWGERPLVGISLREPGGAAPGMTEEHYHALVAGAADFIVERYGANLLFIPMEPRTQDLQHSHAAISQMRFPQRAFVLQGEYGPRQILSLIGKLDFAVGMRLHFLIFSAMQRVPFVALPYASKVSGFIEAAGLEMPPLEDITTGQFLAYLDKTWDGREQVREKLDQTIPPLQEQARENQRILMEMLKTLPTGESER